MGQETGQCASGTTTQLYFCTIRALTLMVCLESQSTVSLHELLVVGTYFFVIFNLNFSEKPK